MSTRDKQKSDQFLCSICLDGFTDPVTTPCGHNFCNPCITRHWEVNAALTCPLCKERFKSRPQLKVNTLLRDMVDQFRGEAKELQPGETNAAIQEMIHKRRLKIQELKKSVKTGNDAADRKTAEAVQVFSALIETAHKGLDELIKQIQEKQKITESKAGDLIEDLEREISDLMMRSSEEETLSLKDWSKIRVCTPSYDGMVMRAVARLEETLKNKMKMIYEDDLKMIQQYAVDVTLDPDSAHPNLILSDDGKQVYCGDARRNVSDNPKRFTKCVNVLGRPSFSSGRFYFEVQVKGKTEWTLGAARETIKRTGKITLSPADGFWTVWLRNGNEYKALADKRVRLHLQSAPQKVGVFVDYEEGLVSFYDGDTAALIFSFSGCCFSEKLHPYFSPCTNDGGKNSAPLVICPVNQTF